MTPEQKSKPLAEHEKSFDPGDYRKAEEEEEEVKTPPPPVKEKEGKLRWVERMEKTMGYRIQLFSTTSIDEAQAQVARYRQRLDSMQVAAGRLDMTFDAPYYKVRMGDFLLRPPADSLRRLLHEQGMQEAWVVRDRVERTIRVQE
ncbi:MAG: SPOR domain-containing protein [Bacteroidota bacterium]|nr:SPOR domain-containing protein [Bacteroidota bacterium]